MAFRFVVNETATRRAPIEAWYVNTESEGHFNFLNTDPL